MISTKRCEVYKAMSRKLDKELRIRQITDNGYEMSVDDTIVLFTFPDSLCESCKKHFKKECNLIKRMNNQKKISNKDKIDFIVSQMEVR